MENGGNKDKSDLPRVKGSEVFVGGLQQSVTEEMIHEVFSKCGEIVEIRMMTDHNGALKGYCFVRFTTRDAALKAQKEKNGMILQGKKIGVAPSTDQDTLFLGNIKKDWNHEELESMVRQAFQDVKSVDLAMAGPSGDSPSDRKQQNRGFAFVHFDTHAAAARAYRVANRSDFLLGGKWHPVIDWASSGAEPDPEEMSKVKIAFVGNLPNNAKEDFLKKLFEPFGKLDRVAVSRKSNTPVGFVHFVERSDLDAAIKELDGKVVDGIDKGSKIKLQVSVAKPADKSKKRGREETRNTGVPSTGALGKMAGALGTHNVAAGAFGEYADYPITKYPRLATKSYNLPEATDPYELAVLALPTKVTDKLLQIFRQGLVSQHEVDINVLESLRELPEPTATAVLDKFAGANFSEIRNKGAYLASMINRSRKELREKGGLPNQGAKSLAASAQIGRNLHAASRESGLLGLGVTAASHPSVLDSYNIPHAPTDIDLYGYDGYGLRSSLSILPTLSGGLTSEPLLPRVPSLLGDTHALSSYRLGASTVANLGLGIGATPELSGVERRPFKFDPYTGEPYKFDPYTGEPLESSGIPSTRLGGKYY